ncbi:MAG: hypothetical protein WBC44_05800 [Planctomycetaceae bacterium]
MSDLKYVVALERQNRLLRRLIAMGCGLLFVVAVTGANVTGPLVVQEELVIKDRNGVTRFEMVVHDGHGLSNGFHVVDAKGQTRIDIGITPRGEPVIAFLDDRGRTIRTLP